MKPKLRRIFSEGKYWWTAKSDDCYGNGLSVREAYENWKDRQYIYRDGSWHANTHPFSMGRVWARAVQCGSMTTADLTMALRDVTIRAIEESRARNRL